MFRMFINFKLSINLKQVKKETQVLLKSLPSTFLKNSLWKTSKYCHCSYYYSSHKQPTKKHRKRSLSAKHTHKHYAMKTASLESFQGMVHTSKASVDNEVQRANVSRFIACQVKCSLCYIIRHKIDTFQISMTANESKKTLQCIFRPLTLRQMRHRETCRHCIRRDTVHTDAVLS